MNPYKILEIERSATSAQIKAAYRKLADKHHPDRDGGSAEKFQEIQAAYELLMDEGKRARFDATGRHWCAPSIDDVWKMIGDLLVSLCHEKDKETDPDQIIHRSLYNRDKEVELFNLIRQQIAAGNEKHKLEIQKLKRKEKRWNRLLERFRRLNSKIEGTPKYQAVVNLLEKQALDCVKFIPVLEQKIEFGELALAEMDGLKLDQNFDESAGDHFARISSGFRIGTGTWP